MAGVVDATTSLDEVSFTFELPDLDDLPSEVRKELVDDVGAYIVESILDYVGDAKSPVAGGKYKATLNQTYADREKAGDDKANLDLNGDMLNALTFEPDYSTGRIKVGIFDGEQTPKAYNHNVGDTLPQRKFIPEEGDELKAEIVRGIRRIIEEYTHGDEE